MNHGDRTISTVDGAKQRQSDGVVSAQSNNTGQCLALDRRTSLVGIRSRGTRKNVEMAFLNLAESPCVVVSEDGQSECV